MKTRRFRFASLLAVGCASLSAQDAASAHWPQFRGANGSGLAAGAKPPTKIGPAEGVVWSVEVPWSPSSPCVWGERIFVTTFAEPNLEVRCYERATGTLRWTRAFTPEHVEEFHRSDGSPAASTPATDGQRVVSYFGSFGLVCHDFEGKELWRRPLPAAESYGQYGSGASPIIVGPTVVLNRDQYRYSSLLALDLASGALLWETPRPEAGGSFGSAAHWRNNGVDEIVLGASARLKGYDLRTGVERWVVEGITGLVCTTPVIAGDRLIFGGWSNAVADSAVPPWDQFLKTYNKNGDDEVTPDEIPIERRDYWRGVDANRDGKYTKEDWEIRKARNARAANLLIAVTPGGTGDISDSHVAWKYRQGLPYVPSPLFYDGRIYFVRDGGLMSSLDPQTGEPHYTQERLTGALGGYYASPVAADGRIYLASLLGKLTVVKAGGDKPEILHQADFGERILATPALVGERLYLRTTTKLWAFGR